MNRELAHFGVLGMKWGVRRNRGSTGTVGSGIGSGRRALQKATADGNKAAKESIAKSRASSDSSKLGSGRKALNEAGKARREAAKESLAESKADAKKARDADTAIKTQRKQTSAVRRHLSDGDLKAAIERLQNEKKLKELTAENIAPGKTKAISILDRIGTAAIGTAGAAVATYAIKAAMEQKFDIKEAAKFIRPKK